ncbi:CLUMA_CG010906, isoform A [Clunio marinus]|uniref:CLUMA_CG010906, isoform A n=1 Tax=Clunio marinus TaxID=568069 RepID=A0A1J1IB58_9DIPT|nr:CLUMA_CG010906, isoform A [Clunio marinus]
MKVNTTKQKVQSSLIQHHQAKRGETYLVSHLTISLQTIRKVETTSVANDIAFKMIRNVKQMTIGIQSALGSIESF